MYLHFPDLDPGRTGKLQELHIGFCYMPGLTPAGDGDGDGIGDGDGDGDSDGGRHRGEAAAPESEIVRPLRVRNVSDRKLYLTCTPNLRKQCLVYAADVPSMAEPGGDESSMVALGEEAVGGGGGGTIAAAAAAAAAMPRPQVADLLLLPQSETTLYIGLRPVLPNEAYTSG